MEIFSTQRIFLLLLVFSSNVLASDNLETIAGRKRNFEDSDIIDLVGSSNKSSRSFPWAIDLVQNEEGASTSVTDRISTPHPLCNPKKLSFQSSGSKSSSQVAPVPVATASTVEVLSEEVRKWREHFMMAVKANDADRLERLCSENNNANFRIYSLTKSGHFTYPLHYALQHDLIEAANFIINEMDFDPDALDSFEHTALTITIERSLFRQFTDLLDRSDLSVRVRGGLGLTHFAASMDIISHMFLQALHRKGLDFTEPCAKHGWTPLTYAVIANNLVLALWIINNTHCDLTLPANRDIILFALRYGDEDIIIQLIFHGANIRSVDHRKRNIFHYIAKKGLKKVLSHISTLNAKVCYDLLSSFDKNGFLPVHLAAKQNNFALISGYMLEYFDLNAKTTDGRSVIQVAIESGSAEVVGCMLADNLFDYSESFNGEQNPPVLVIAYKLLRGHPRKLHVMEAILFTLYGEFVEAENSDRRYLYDEFGLNIIHYAVKDNDLELLKLIVDDYRMDVNFMENTNANSPLSWAIYSNNPQMVRYLLDHGASTNERIRLSCFNLDESLPDFNEAEDDEDAMELDQLAEIFGGEEIVKLLQKVRR